MDTTTSRLNRTITATIALLFAISGLAACTRSAATEQGTETVTDGGATSGPTASTPQRDPDPVSSPSTVARLGHAVTVHQSPNDSSPAIVELAAKTELGSTTTLLVLDQRDGWLHVALPVRPNGTKGWLRASQAELRTVDYRVDVDLAARTLTVERGGAVAVQTPIALGAASTPTPTGDYFVTDILDTDTPNGAYGPFALGLSGHSETLTEFAGGDGQIGIHGTNDPSSIGKPVSHGCVRVPNDVISALASALPLGTPVAIH